MSYFHHFLGSKDPQILLRPEEHVSTPWGSAKRGPCDKCRERPGSVRYRCLSCMETGPRAECPACMGRVEFLDTCPTCGGTSQIDDTVRAGVSVFPTLEGLYRYLVEREAELGNSVIVELDGRLSDARDLDADSGALLIHPTEVITRHPIDGERVADLRVRLADLEAEAS
jgi:DnaJ-class molecular chaperone